MPFHALTKLAMAVSSIRAGNKLRPEEERAIFTFTKILQTHQLNMLFGTLEAEVLYQVEQTWGVNFPSEEIKLTIPDHAQYRRLLLPADMTVREALDRYRPRWHQEQDIGLYLSRQFEARSDPYTLRIDCKCNSADVRFWEHRDDSP